jgi:hypothetical protein
MDVSDLTQMMPKRFTHTTILGSGNSAIAAQGPGALFGQSTRNLRFLQSIEQKQISEITMKGRLRKDQ